MNCIVSYSLKVWLTAVFVSPVILSFIDIFKYHKIEGILPMMLLSALVGGVFSAPSMLMLCIATYLISLLDNCHLTYQKLILSIAGIGLTLLPFWYFGIWMLGPDSAFIVVYASVIVAGVWIYTLNPVDSAQKK